MSKRWLQYLLVTLAALVLLLPGALLWILEPWNSVDNPDDGVVTLLQSMFLEKYQGEFLEGSEYQLLRVDDVYQFVFQDPDGDMQSAVWVNGMWVDTLQQ